MEKEGLSFFRDVMCSGVGVGVGVGVTISVKYFAGEATVTSTPACQARKSNRSSWV
jgi:hypothetical protein